MNVSKWAPEKRQAQADKWKSRWTKELKKKKKMRTDREGKCIFPQAPSFPQNLCGSHLLHLPPLKCRCNPGVRSSGVISISEFCSYLCCHCKMAKPKPQQNLLFHTAQAVNCPLFTLRLCFIQPWRGSNICKFIHREPSQTLSTLFTTVYLFFPSVSNWLGMCSRRKNNEVKRFA